MFIIQYADIVNKGENMYEKTKNLLREYYKPNIYMKYIFISQIEKKSEIIGQYVIRLK